MGLSGEALVARADARRDQGETVMFVVLDGAVAGLVSVAINARFKAREVDHYLNDSGSVALIVSDDFAALAREALHGAPSVRHVIGIGAQHGFDLDRLTEIAVQRAAGQIHKQAPAEGRPAVAHRVSQAGLPLAPEGPHTFPGHAVVEHAGQVEAAETRVAADEVEAQPALAHVARLYRHLCELMGDRPFDFEVSVDETETPTTVHEHYYIATELQRLGVTWVSLAPRFVGRFEKGVDFIGDLDELEQDIAESQVRIDDLETLLRGERAQVPAAEWRNGLAAAIEIEMDLDDFPYARRTVEYPLLALTSLRAVLRGETPEPWVLREVLQ